MAEDLETRLLLTAKDELGPLLVKIAAQFAAINSSAVELSLGVGLVAYGLNKVADAAKPVLEVLAKMEATGWSTADAYKAQGEALKAAASTPLATYDKSLEMLRQLTGVTGNLGSASAALPDILRAQGLLTAIGGGHDVDVIGLAKQFGSRQLQGPDDVEALKDYLNTITKIAQATQGIVSPADIMKTYRFGGLGAADWSPEFANQILPQLMKDLAAGGAGGGGMAGMMGNLGNIMNSATTELLKAQAGNKKTPPNPFLTGVDVSGKDPYAAAQQIMKNMQAAGITTPEGVDEQLRKIFGTSSGGSRAAMAYRDMMLRGSGMLGAQSPFEQMRGAVANAPGNTPEALHAYVGQSPSAQLQEFNDALKTFAEAIGVPIAQMKLAAMSPLVDYLQQMNKALAGIDPTTMKYVVDIGLGIVGVLGSIAIVALAIPLASMVGIGAAIGGLALAFTTFLALDFKGVEKTFSQLFSYISDFLNKLWNLIPGHSSMGLGGSGSLNLTPQLQSYTPGGAGNAITPGGGAKVIQINTTMDIDGRTLAQAVSSHVIDLNEHSSGAPSSDAYSLFSGDGDQITGT